MPPWYHQAACISSVARACVDKARYWAYTLPMTDRELIDTVLVRGQLTLFFKLCATNSIDPLEVRYNGFNVLTALLLSPRDCDDKLDDLEGLLSGYHNLGRIRLNAMLREPVFFIEAGQSMPSSCSALEKLVQRVSLEDFELLYLVLLSKGYTPEPALAESLEATLHTLHPGERSRIARLFSH